MIIVVEFTAVARNRTTFARNSRWSHEFIALADDGTSVDRDGTAFTKAAHDRTFIAKKGL